ncbi:formin-like protein 5 [Mesocricetus auratus]|uniref:Formin-like protein 5 n=1 Tax=Mesocricetus auratus TaxID=10036 RepID=A0ABM2WC03_MESAU|nr:formin-like protein 5 [Mesocricetus auratus]
MATLGWPPSCRLSAPASPPKPGPRAAARPPGSRGAPRAPPRAPPAPRPPHPTPGARERERALPGIAAPSARRHLLRGRSRPAVPSRHLPGPRAAWRPPDPCLGRSARCCPRVPAASSLRRLCARSLRPHSQTFPSLVKLVPTTVVPADREDSFHSPTGQMKNQRSQSARLQNTPLFQGGAPWA